MPSFSKQWKNWIRSQKSIFSKFNKGFYSVFESYKGSNIAEEYRILSQKIQIEKYAPVKSEEGIDELYDTIVNLYSSISK
jgi:nitrogenase subunit NifH